MNTDTHFLFPADPDAFVRAPDCARFLSIGLSTWWAWVRMGRVERPTKLGPQTSVWKAGYVRSLHETLSAEVNQK